MLGTLAIIFYRVDITTQPLLSYGGIYGGMSALLSFVSNLIATVLIGQKAWYARIGASTVISQLTMYRVSAPGGIENSCVRVLALRRADGTPQR